MVIGIIALFLLLFGGSGTLENYLLNIKKPVKVAVEDKQTAGKIVDLSKILGKELKAENKKITELKNDFLGLHRSYRATQEDFSSTLKEMVKARKDGQKAILDTRFGMKDFMTEQEWNKVFNAQNKKKKQIKSS